MSSATRESGGVNPEVLTMVFGALSDPTRRAIVDRLTMGEATMSEIASQFDMSLPGVSKHVSVLEKAGMVHRRRTGRTRRCRLDKDRMRLASDWLTERTIYWTDTLENLANFVEEEGHEQ